MNDGMQNIRDMQPAEWLYRYKRKIILGVILVLSLAVIATIFTIALVLRARLLDDSKGKTRELSQVIRLSLSNLMLVRNPGSIQTTLEAIRSGESSVVRAFILDKGGRVAYSSEKREIGAVIDRFTERSCNGCHTGPVTVPQETTMLIRVDGQDVLRNVEIIHNEKPCHACHPASDRINGKLIIDRSMQATSALITKVELMLVFSGLFCLVVLVPFMSRVVSKGMDKYIKEILLKSSELSLLYRIVERLSKTIDMEELKTIVVEIIREILDTDEIDVIFPKENREYGGIVWKKKENKVDRRMFPEDDPDRDAISAWVNDELREEKISGEKNVIYMPIVKNDARLALIIAKKSSGSFDRVGISLVRAMGSHIAVALENAALYQLAITDELTGLYSQRHFRNVMEKKFALYEHFGEKMTLLMIDIDNFKKINDTYGHPAGDRVLKEVGHCLRASTRDEDTDFRYGGEEFAVILPATGSKGGSFVAERIRAMIAGNAFMVEDRRLDVTVSIGVASCPEHAATIRDMIVAADKALYEAKRAGKNRVALSAGKA
jgi:diguanylate cyclase (GGDEF)-like protein